MNQFQEFTVEKLIQTYEKNEGKMNRNDIYKFYSQWFYDHILVNAIYDEDNYRLIPEIYKYGKIIGRPEFYKLLIQVYGAPLINRKTKQYSYYFKKIV
jgi:hypothetical protein